jgi:hypothetical protein
VVHQRFHGPAGQRLVVRLEGHQVVQPQPFQAVGQAAGEPPPAPADDDHVEQSLLHRQVTLHFDHEGGAAEQVGQQRAEQAVPVAQGFAFDGHRMVLFVTTRLYEQLCTMAPFSLFLR